MALRWQQWMPFHIDKFRGSPEVQAMHPCSRIGYLYLLASAWQTDDCAVSSDPIDLATESGLGDELWAIYGPRILRKFYALDSGKLQNKVLLEEWNAAYKKFIENQRKAEKLNKKLGRGGKKTSDVEEIDDARPESDEARTHLQEQEQEQEQSTTPLTPLPGGMRKSEQRKLAKASIGMIRTSELQATIDEADKRSENEALSFWRDVRGRDPSRWECGAPDWIKKRTQAEQESKVA